MSHVESILFVYDTSIGDYIITKEAAIKTAEDALKKGEIVSYRIDEVKKEILVLREDRHMDNFETVDEGQLLYPETPNDRVRIVRVLFTEENNRKGITIDGDWYSANAALKMLEYLKWHENWLVDDNAKAKDENEMKYEELQQFFDVLVSANPKTLQISENQYVVASNESQVHHTFTYDEWKKEMIIDQTSPDEKYQQKIILQEDQFLPMARTALSWHLQKESNELHRRLFGPEPITEDDGLGDLDDHPF